MAERLMQALPLKDEAATIELGGLLARHLPADTAGWLLLLQGDLGAGKSTLARALLRALGHHGPVPSPTYTLVEPYSFAGGEFFHIDLYRVADADELAFLGWDDLAEGLRLVEWPERVPALFAQADLVVHLDYDGEGRRALFETATARGRDWLKALPL